MSLCAPACCYAGLGLGSQPSGVTVNTASVDDIVGLLQGEPRGFGVPPPAASSACFQKDLVCVHPL